MSTETFTDMIKHMGVVAYTHRITLSTVSKNGINIYSEGDGFVGKYVAFEYNNDTKMLSIFTFDEVPAVEEFKKLTTMPSGQKFAHCSAWKVMDRVLVHGQKIQIPTNVIAIPGGQRFDLVINLKEDFAKKYAGNQKPYESRRTSSLATKLKKSSTERTSAPLVALVQPATQNTQISKTRVVDTDMFDTLRDGGYELLSGTVLCKNSAGEIVEITIIN